LMGKKRKWQNDEFILGLFGKRAAEARRNYRAYVEKGIVERGTSLNNPIT